jgi:16S rRNA (guanine527-N7)-methyltransferase
LIDRAVAAGLPLTDAAARQLWQYFELLARWNTKINLTSLPLVRAPQEAIERLLIEPLSVARQLEDEPLRWIDLGSGGGSPAIPMKIYRLKLRLTMVESRARKASFLREAIRALGLVDAEVENLRFEDLVGRKELRGVVDLVTARGIRADAQLLSVCRALLTEQGHLVAFGSDSLPAESGFVPLAHPWFFQRCST